MIDEFTLFKDNIKPAILSNKESLIKNDIVNQYIKLNKKY